MKEYYKRYFEGGHMSAEQVKMILPMWGWTPLDWEYITGLSWEVDEV